ncbi:MAG: hypothetical protein KDB01_10330, partial [Planctomycetaceae bacterium]|nr:hypothetical protein [Planctomycetaceae bacterium]
ENLFNNNPANGKRRDKRPATGGKWTTQGVGTAYDPGLILGLIAAVPAWHAGCRFIRPRARPVGSRRHCATKTE